MTAHHDSDATSRRRRHQDELALDLSPLEPLERLGGALERQHLVDGGPQLALGDMAEDRRGVLAVADRKSTRLNSSHSSISYAVFCLKKKKKTKTPQQTLYVK